MNVRRRLVAQLSGLGVLLGAFVLLLPVAVHAQPDLVVSRVQLQVIAGDGVHAVTTVKNVGDKDAGPSKLFWSSCTDITGPPCDPGGTFLVGEIRVPALKAKAEITQSWGDHAWAIGRGVQFLFEADASGVDGYTNPVGEVQETVWDGPGVHGAYWAVGETNNAFVVPYVSKTAPGTYTYRNPRAGLPPGTPSPATRAGNLRTPPILQDGGPDLRIFWVDVEKDDKLPDCFTIRVKVENRGNVASKACTLGVLWRVGNSWEALMHLAPQAIPVIPAQGCSPYIVFPLVKCECAGRLILWADAPVAGANAFGLNKEPTVTLVSGTPGKRECDSVMVIPLDPAWPGLKYAPAYYRFDGLWP